MPKLRQRESLAAAGAGQRVDGAPHSPVDIAPGLQLRLEFYQMVVDVKGGVFNMTVGQLASIVHSHPAQRKEVHN